MTAKEIKDLRLKLLLTQTEFAKKLGVKFLTVNRWENSHAKPMLRHIRKMRKLEGK